MKRRRGVWAGRATDVRWDKAARRAAPTAGSARGSCCCARVVYLVRVRMADAIRNTAASGHAYLEHFNVQQIFTLSLRHRVDRRNRVAAQVAMLGNVSHSFVDGLEPKGPAWNGTTGGVAASLTCRSGLECCYQGWRKMIALSLDLDKFPLLGTEDDVVLSPARYTSNRTRIPAIPKDANLISIASACPRQTAPPLRFVKPLPGNSGGGHMWNFGTGAMIIPSRKAATYIGRFLMPYNPTLVEHGFAVNKSRAFHTRYTHTDAKLFYGGLHGMYILCPPLLGLVASTSDVSGKVKKIKYGDAKYQGDAEYTGDAKHEHIKSVPAAKTASNANHSQRAHPTTLRFDLTDFLATLALPSRTTTLDNPGLFVVRLFTLVGASYLETLARTVATLEMLGRSRRDFIVGCIDDACAVACAAASLEFLPNGFGGDLSFRIASIKFYAILTVLQRGEAVLSFDVDVFFFQDPVRDFPLRQLLTNHSSPYDAVVQLDEFPTKRHPRLNFGFFAARPTIEMQTLFRDLWAKYNRTAGRIWDQQLFNEAFGHLKNVGLLPLERYRNFMLDVSGHEGPADPCPPHLCPSPGQSETRAMPVCAHMTCVDGVANKELMARSAYGSADVGGYYSTPRKTISLLDHEAVAWAAEWLVSLAATLDRAVRPSEWVTNLSPDKLARHNVSMVEPSYWENVRRYRPGYSRTTSVVVLNQSSYERMAQQGMAIAMRSVDEITLMVPSDLLREKEYRTAAFAYMCTSQVHPGKHKPLATWRKSPCLQWCDMSKFHRWG